MQSPDYLKTSLAAAMTLGFVGGRFYRDARLYCINVLLTYNEGCAANCAYCGLQREREGTHLDKSFIRVQWPAFGTDDIALRTLERRDKLGRICISMITRDRAADDTREVIKRIRSRTDIPISVLSGPTILKKKDFEDFRNLGADRIGIAIDAATEELFDLRRGKGVGGPHRWGRYWRAVEESADVFDPWHVGIHWVYGLGETEQDLALAIWRTHELGAVTHLFSFFPEPGSAMQDSPQPPVGGYRRIQLFRYLVDEAGCSIDDVDFDGSGHISGFKIDARKLDEIINSGVPFETSGCPGHSDVNTWRVACNRPFGNEKPGNDLRNYPFSLEPEDIELVRSQLWEV